MLNERRHLFWAGKSFRKETPLMTEPLLTRAEWLTVRDIAALLHVGEDTVRRWIRAKKIEAKFFGGRTGYRIRNANLQVFLQEQIQGRPGASRRFSLVMPRRNEAGNVTDGGDQK